MMRFLILSLLSLISFSGASFGLEYARSQFNFELLPDSGYAGSTTGGFTGNLIQDNGWTCRLTFPERLVTFFYKIEVSSGNYFGLRTPGFRGAQFLNGSIGVQSYLAYDLFKTPQYNAGRFQANETTISSYRASSIGSLSITNVLYLQVNQADSTTFRSRTYYQDNLTVTASILNANGTVATDNFNQPLVFSLPARVLIYTGNSFSVTYNGVWFQALDFTTVSEHARIPFSFSLSASGRIIRTTMTSTNGGMLHSASGTRMPYSIYFHNSSQNYYQTSNPIFQFMFTTDTPSQTQGLSASFQTSVAPSQPFTVFGFLFLPPSLDFSQFPPGDYTDNLTLSFTEL
jgi:hypothetical protein